MKLSEVVPWGRNADEYRRMFDLTRADLEQSILGCGDGPACFNAEISAQGGRVVSVDPLYAFSPGEIRGRVDATYATIIDQVKQTQDAYVWHEFAGPDDLGRVRLAAMETFLADYATGRTEGRYVTGSLPDLDFADSQFDLALCSHLLFLYSEQLGREFHLAAVQELLRVAPEVRIFPVLALGCVPSPHLEPVMAHAAAQDVQVELRPVPYEFMVGGNHMLRLVRGETKAS
jgi:hypothetical protein